MTNGWKAAIVLALVLSVFSAWRSSNDVSAEVATQIKAREDRFVARYKLGVESMRREMGLAAKDIGSFEDLFDMMAEMLDAGHNPKVDERAKGK